MPSPIGYDAVLAVVILELLFAFGIGISCIIFSFNLFWEVSSGDVQGLPVGDLPNRMSHRGSFGTSSSQAKKGGDPDYNTFEDEESVTYLVPDEARMSEAEYDHMSQLPTRRSHTGIQQRDSDLEEEEHQRQSFYAGSIVQNFLEYVRFW